MSTMTIEHRRFDGTTGDIGGINATVGDFTVAFDGGAVSDTYACRSCGAAVADWRYATGQGGQKESGPKVNIERHVAFHARLGF